MLFRLSQKYFKWILKIKYVLAVNRNDNVEILYRVTAVKWFKQKILFTSLASSTDESYLNNYKHEYWQC